MSYEIKDLREISETRGFKFENMYISFDGNVYKIAGDNKHLLPRKTSQRYTGLRVFAIRGGYVNLGRLIATWKKIGMPDEVSHMDYLRGNVQAKWLNGLKTDCAFVNIEPREDEVKKRKSDEIYARIWAIRDMYLSGVEIIEIAQYFGVTVNYVRTLCAGFDRVRPDNAEKLVSVCRSEKLKNNGDGEQA